MAGPESRPVLARRHRVMARRTRREKKPHRPGCNKNGAHQLQEEQTRIENASAALAYSSCSSLLYCYLLALVVRAWMVDNNAVRQWCTSINEATAACYNLYGSEQCLGSCPCTSEEFHRSEPRASISFVVRRLAAATIRPRMSQQSGSGSLLAAPLIVPTDGSS